MCFKTMTARKKINLEIIGTLMTFIPTKGGEMLREGMKLEEKENQRVNPEKHPHFMSVLGRGAEKGLRRKSH